MSPLEGTLPGIKMKRCARLTGCCAVWWAFFGTWYCLQENILQTVAIAERYRFFISTVMKPRHPAVFLFVKNYE